MVSNCCLEEMKYIQDLYRRTLNLLLHNKHREGVKDAKYSIYLDIISLLKFKYGYSYLYYIRYFDVLIQQALKKERKFPSRYHIYACLFNLEKVISILKSIIKEIVSDQSQVKLIYAGVSQGEVESYRLISKFIKKQRVNLNQSKYSFSTERASRGMDYVLSTWQRDAGRHYPSYGQWVIKESSFDYTQYIYLYLFSVDINI